MSEIGEQRDGPRVDPGQAGRAVAAAMWGGTGMPISNAAMAVLVERNRQVQAKGYTAAEDDGYTKGELAKAAHAYVLQAVFPAFIGGQPDAVPWSWPWSRSTFKRGSIRRMLAKAAALIIAEIERVDRAGGGV